MMRLNSWRRLLSRDGQSRKLFHVKPSDFEAFRMLHVKHRDSSVPMFHVKPGSLVPVNRLNQELALLSDAELAEDDVQNVLDVDPAEQSPQRIGSGTKVLRSEFFALINGIKATLE